LLGGVDSSKTLILESTVKLQENKVTLKKLVEIPCSDDKLSILYYIAVEQMQIRKEAFDYFENLQKNLDNTGGLFSKMPSEIKGNIICVTEPEEAVIGYVEVTSIEKKDLFIPTSEDLYEKPRDTCPMEITNDSDIGYPILLLSQSPGMPSLYAPTRCIDCRSKPHASKTKPDFWPTDHL